MGLSTCSSHIACAPGGQDGHPMARGLCMRITRTGRARTQKGTIFMLYHRMAAPLNKLPLMMGSIAFLTGHRTAILSIQVNAPVRLPARSIEQVGMDRQYRQ